MTALVQATKQQINTLGNAGMPHGILWKAALAFGVTSLALMPGDTGNVVRIALSDAFLQVSVFVTATLLAFYTLESRLKVDPQALLARYAPWQVAIAGVLGMLPGCGGAIIVVTLFVRGGISFGALVAALTSTMGDAAFVLIAQQPATGAITMALSLAVGIATGYGVDRLHGTDFMRPKSSAPRPDQPHQTPTAPPTASDYAWLILAAPGLVMGILLLAQVDLGEQFAAIGLPPLALGLGVLGSLAAFAIWATRGADSDNNSNACPNHCGARAHVVSRTTSDAAFVASWVAVSYLAYEMIVLGFGLDVSAMMQTWGALVPLLAIMIGFIPGCGPQIVVTTLHLNGALPYSALLGNAISNDGDALLPAVIMAPKGAIVATLYSAVPAIIAAYGIYVMFEL